MEKEKIEKLFAFLKIAQELKSVYRWESSPGISGKESSAAHSWRMSLMAFIIARDFNIKVDIEKVLMMALIHDLVESLTGDIDYIKVSTGKFSKKEKIDNEYKAIEKISNTLPKKTGKEIYKLWIEFEKAKTKEARYLKALDRIETLDHFVSVGDVSSIKGADIIPLYGNEALSNFPELIPLLKRIKKKMKALYKKKGIQWKVEYDK